MSRPTPQVHQMREEATAVCLGSAPSTDPFRGDIRVIITGPHGFERRVAFAIDEESSEITRRVRESIDE